MSKFVHRAESVSHRSSSSLLIGIKLFILFCPVVFLRSCLACLLPVYE